MSKKEKRAAVVVAVVLVVLAVTSFVKATCMEYTTVEVVVQEGDSLWSIWEEVGHGRFDDWKIKVERVNEQDLSVLHPCDRIVVPIIK